MSQVQYEGEIDLVAGQLLAHGGEPGLVQSVRDANEALVIQALKEIADLKLRNRLVSIIQRLGPILGRFR